MDENEDFAMDLSISDDDDPGYQLRKTCANVFNKTHFVDVTLSCQDGQVQAHRIVLSSASSQLYNLFVSTPWPTPCSHPVIILRKSLVADVRSTLEFIYSGKTRTSKNKLLALMEIARELGFATLLKSIEIAIQSCGIEMFRRLSANSVKDMSRYSTSSSSEQQPTQKQPQNLSKSNFAKEIKIREELLEFEDRRNLSHKMNDSTATLKRYIQQSSPNSRPTKLKRMSGPDKNYNQSQQMDDNNSWVNNKQALYRNGKSKGQNEVDSYNISSSTPLDLQHEKGESFVYTNEDLGMMGMDDEDDDDDQNESADEREFQSMAIPSAKSIFTTKANGGENSLNSLKVEIKEELEDGVPASCPWCLQVFTSLSLLQRHIKTHVGNYKPFTCEYCQNTFARSAHLKRHLRTHTGEKPYQCSICQRPFARQDKLKVHLERHVHPLKNGTNSMTITSYPPPSMSQTSGGQVPIKVLIPSGQQGGNGHRSSTTNSPSDMDSISITSSPLSPLSLQRAGTSITVTSTTVHPSPHSERGSSKNINGSPSPPTITPISNLMLGQKRLGKSANLNFLVN